MKLIKEFKFKLDFLGWISQILPMYIVFKLIPFEYLGNRNFLLFVTLFLFINRFPHEYFHKIGGNIVGVKSTIEFKKINATCTPESILNWKQLLIFALAPFILLTFFNFIFVTIFYFISEFIFYLFFTNMILSFANYSADIGYAYNAIKHKDCLFKDTGSILKIYSPLDA